MSRPNVSVCRAQILKLKLIEIDYTFSQGLENLDNALFWEKSLNLIQQVARYLTIAMYLHLFYVLIQQV